MSSRLRLLLDSVPLSRVDPSVLSSQEDQVLAWQLEMGQELAAENVPLAYVVLVVEGTLRISGRDALGQPFTLRRIHAGEWWGLWSGLSGVAAAALPKQLNCLLYRLRSGNPGVRSLLP